MQKLKPFFPPMDQVQSINLRAALLRSLEQAKKSGVLGRDTILRKTMLDECKGERLEDVLASFSSAVLKKVVGEDSEAGGGQQAIALSLALENRGYKDDKAELSALVLAHRASLHKLWEQRQAADARFRDFADFLATQEKLLLKRKEKARQREDQSDSQSVSEDAYREMRRTVRNNWSGNERWMETLLYGDAASKKEGPFSMPFDRVWRRVEQERLSELEAEGTGLLEQLDGRVKAHRDRLDKWEGYRKSMFGGRSEPAPSPSKKTAAAPKSKGINLGFGAHESLRIGRMSPRKAVGDLKPTNKINDEYSDLLADLKKELADAEKTPSGSLAFLRARRRAQRGDDMSAQDEQSEDQVSEISELEEEAFQPHAPIRSFQSRLEKSKRLPARPVLQRPDLRPLDTLSIPEERPESEHSRRSSQQSSPRRRIVTPTDPRLLDSEVQPIESPARADPSPTRKAADLILESMNNASPSPAKPSKPRHTLSLAERTRLSMAPRNSSLFLEDDEPEPTTSSVDTPPQDDEGVAQTSPTDEPEDLISRTRKSMAGFDKARQKAQMERRRSLRKSKVLSQQQGGSYFSKVDEETQDQGALAEELMAEQDMEAIFRSRPKIVASPMPSPTKLEFDDDYSGL